MAKGGFAKQVLKTDLMKMHKNEIKKMVASFWRFKIDYSKEKLILKKISIQLEI